MEFCSLSNRQCLCEHIDVYLMDNDGLLRTFVFIVDQLLVNRTRFMKVARCSDHVSFSI